MFWVGVPFAPLCKFSPSGVDLMFERRRWEDGCGDDDDDDVYDDDNGRCHSFFIYSYTNLSSFPTVYCKMSLNLIFLLIFEFLILRFIVIHSVCLNNIILSSSVKLLNDK